jgi:hypothetical protein
MTSAMFHFALHQTLIESDPGSGIGSKVVVEVGTNSGPLKTKRSVRRMRFTRPEYWKGIMPAK